MRRGIAVAIALALAMTFTGWGTDQAQAKKRPNMIEFETMVGLPKAYTGTANPIQGVNGGGLPWIIDSAKGVIGAKGDVRVEVEGLVFDPSDADVVARGLANSNTVAAFMVVVSCRSVDADGNATTVVVSTDPAPATVGLASDGGGNAEIRGQIELPKPCIAPIVFVTSPTGAWFASTGA